MIATSSGSQYQLMGEIELLDAVDAGIPESLAMTFKHGFPVNWKELIAENLVSNIDVTSNSIVSQGPTTALLEVTNLVSQQTLRNEVNNVGKQVVPIPEQNNNDLSKNKEDDNVVIPSNSGNETNENPTDNVVNEVCAGENVSITNSIKTKTMVDKVLVEKVNKPPQPQKKMMTRSKQKENRQKDTDSSAYSEGEPEDSYTQDKTPFSRRQKRQLISDDEIEESTDVNSTDTCSIDNLSGSKRKKHKLMKETQKRETRSSASSDTVVSDCTSKEREKTKKSKKHLKPLTKSPNKLKVTSASAKIKSVSPKTVSSDIVVNGKRKPRMSSDLSLISTPKIDAPVRVFTLSDWIIRPLKKVKGVLVEGKRSGIDEYWRSSSIAERRDGNTVVTDSGSVYRLVGNIQKLDAIDAGFSPELIQSFNRGFPKKWRELISNHFNSEDEGHSANGTISNKSSSVSKLKTPAVKNKSKNLKTPEPVNPLNETMVGTPEGQIVDLSTLKQTRSGRVVKPVLASWAGQRVEFDTQTKAMKVVYNTKFAESYFTQQDIQLSAKTVRKRSVKKTNTTDKNKTSVEKNTKKSNHSKTKKDDSPNELVEDVLNIITTSRERRQKQTKRRETCYSTSTSRIHMRDRLATDESDFSHEDASSKPSTALKNKSRNSTSKIQNGELTEDFSHKDASSKPSTAGKNKSRNSTSKIQNGELTEDTESEALPKLGRQKTSKNTNKNTKSKTVKSPSKGKNSSQKRSVSKSESRKNKDSEQSVSDSESEEITFKQPAYEKKSKSNKIAQKSKSKKVENKHHETSNVDDDDDSWGKSEIHRLESAMKCVLPSDKLLWKRLSDAVETRSEQECQEFVKSDKNYKQFLDSIKTVKEKKLVEVTAKKGTMKRKKQIREFLEQNQGDEEQDIFDSTPFRSRTTKMVVPRLDDDDDLFAGGDFPITPGAANYRTPSIKQYLTQFSAKKTPANCIASPVTSAINTKNADKIVHHYLKRRKLTKTKPVKKNELVSIANKRRTLFCPERVDENLFSMSDNDDDDDDEDEEQDYYEPDELMDD
ncbi:mis18-binding protein 1 isoform X2 [Patella vulgata]|nr:mis18-binding protein 1 isoform X2 [Patella vulgata]